VPFFDTSVELFRKVLDINLIGTFTVAREAGRLMRTHGGGAIVNIASISGQRGNLGRSAYGASKGGVINADPGDGLRAGTRRISGSTPSRRGPWRRRWSGRCKVKPTEPPGFGGPAAPLRVARRSLPAPPCSCWTTARRASLQGTSLMSMGFGAAGYLPAN